MPEDFYLDEELKQMAEKALLGFRKIWKKEGIRNKSEEYEEGLKKDLLEIYRDLNLIFGRQDPKKEHAYLRI